MTIGIFIFLLQPSTLLAWITKEYPIEKMGQRVMLTGNLGGIQRKISTRAKVPGGILRERDTDKLILEDVLVRPIPELKTITLDIEACI